jgi:hypothetical protein
MFTLCCSAIPSTFFTVKLTVYFSISGEDMSHNDCIFRINSIAEICFQQFAFTPVKEGLNAKIHLRERQELRSQYDFKGAADIQVF